MCSFSQKERDRIMRTLDCMTALEAGADTTTGFMAVPEESFVLKSHAGLISRHVHIGFYRRDNVRCVKLARAAIKRAAWSYGDVKKAEKRFSRALRGESDAVSRLPRRVNAVGREGSCWPCSCSLVLKPWEEALSARVWLGGEWCRFDRYSVLASAFREMTFFGFEYERASEKRSLAQAREYWGEEAGLSNGREQLGSMRALSKSKNLGNQHYGLKEPDCFASGRRDRLVERVAVMNLNARLAVFTVLEWLLKLE